jgi:hypothetical protein
MQVFDLTQLRDVPAPPGTFVETAHYAGFGSTHTLALNTQGSRMPPTRGPGEACTSSTSARLLHRARPAASADGYSHETQCVVYEGPTRCIAIRRSASAPTNTLTVMPPTKVEPVCMRPDTAETHTPGISGGSNLSQGDGRRSSIGRTWIWDVSDLDACPRNLLRRPDPFDRHNCIGDLVYDRTTAADCGSRRRDVAGRCRVGFFDIYPSDDANYNGA